MATENTSGVPGFFPPPITSDTSSTGIGVDTGGVVMDDWLSGLTDIFSSAASTFNSIWNTVNAPSTVRVPQQPIAGTAPPQQPIAGTGTFQGISTSQMLMFGGLVLGGSYLLSRIGRR